MYNDKTRINKNKQRTMIKHEQDQIMYNTNCLRRQFSHDTDLTWQVLVNKCSFYMELIGFHTSQNVLKFICLIFSLHRANAKRRQIGLKSKLYSISPPTNKLYSISPLTMPSYASVQPTWGGAVGANAVSRIVPSGPVCSSWWTV